MKTLKTLLLLVTIFVSRIACLSLDEIHYSSETFKTLSNKNRDKSLRSAIDTIHRRRQEYPHSLPLQAIRYYERLVPFNKKPDKQVVDNLIGYNQIGSEYSDESIGEDLLSSELALKLSELLESANKGESDVGHRVYNRINRKRKRSTPKHNNLSQMDAIKIDSKHLKNVKNLSQHKNKSIKTLTKRKSGRRVLNDHFNIEESHQNVIKRDRKHIKSLPKQKINSNKKIENKFTAKQLKKNIRKRKVESPVTTDQSSNTNDTNNSTQELKTTDKSIVKELNDILSDDNKTDKKETKELETKVENRTQKLLKPLDDNKGKDLIKKKSKRSDPNIDSLTDDSNDKNEIIDNMSEDIIINPITDKIDENPVENEMQTKNEDLNEWLRKEFYENMAKTLATMRRKRSEDLLNDENDAINAIEESETIGDNIIAIDESDDKDFENNDEIKNYGKLSDDSNNDYVIAAIDDDMKDGILANNGNDGSDDNEDNDNNDSDIDWNDMKEKSKKSKNKRSVSSYFGDLKDDIESNEIDSKRFSRVNDNLEAIEDSLLNEALDLIRETAAKGSQSEVNSNKIGHRLDAAYDIEDMRTALEDLKNTFDKIDGEKDDNEDLFETDITSVVVPDIIDVHKKDSLFENSLTESDSEAKCFGVELLSSDCSSVANLLPSQQIRYSFTESCNWHQICYTCGEIYGLLSSDCDAGFLEASRLSCEGSPSCEAFARLVLAPLRQSRVFYKSSVPQTCYQYQCIRDFLFDTQNTKR